MSLLTSAGLPCPAAIKAQARRTLADPGVTSYGPRFAILRDALKWARHDARREAERFAMPCAARAMAERLDGLKIDYDALFYAPGRFVATEAERAAIDAERARIGADLTAALRAPLPAEFQRAA